MSFISDRLIGSSRRTSRANRSAPRFDSVCGFGGVSMHFVFTARRFALRSCLAVLVCLQGCASFYLHDAATQKQTESAKEAVAALKPNTIFDSESAYLNQLQQAETSVVTAKLAAQRDQEVLMALNGPGPGGLDGLTLLKSWIDGYLLALTGVTDAGCSVKLWRIVDVDPSSSWGSTASLNAFSATFDSTVSRIKSTCSPLSATPLPVPGATASLHDAIAAVTTDLTDIESSQKAGQAARTQMDTALKDAQSQLAAGKTTASQVLTDLKTLQTYLSDANPYIRKYASASLSGEVGNVIAALGPANVSDTTATKQERSGIAVMQALFGVGDAFASPPRVPHPNALAAAQSWLQYVGSQAATQLEGEQIQLQDHQAQLGAVLTEIYYLSKAAESADEIALPSKKLTGTQGLADLINAPDSASTRAIDATVLYYAATWSRGFTADTVGARRGYVDQRRVKLVAGRAASTAWLGTLNPAVATLAEYGSGGFDPQTIVQLLQALGIGAIAAGVNK